MVFLYGPPAVGKLTVGSLVAARGGFRLLHNHVTVDAVTPVFDFGTPEFVRLVGRFRRELVSEAAAAEVDLVVTFVFAPGDEDAVEQLAAPYGADVTFAQLLASPETLRLRVASESRRRHGKITDVATLDDVLERYDCYQRIPGRESLTLDMEELTPDEAAARILEALA